MKTKAAPSEGLLSRRTTGSRIAIAAVTLPVVRYNLPEQVTTAYMAVYHLLGKQLATFPVTQKGNASLTVTSEKLSAGIYIYNIVADGKIVDSKKMIVADK